jgi:hypothetical protein
MPYASEAAGWLQSFAETGMSVLEKQAQPPEPVTNSSALNLRSAPVSVAGRVATRASFAGV